jgi:hypothetical protein
VFCGAHIFSLREVVFWPLAHVQHASIATKIIA